MTVDLSLVVHAVQMAAFLSAFVIAAVLCGALFAGILRVVTQIDDPAISFAARFAAVALALYIGSHALLSEVAGFAERVWSGTGYYY